MSTRYTDLVFTNYPDSIDTILQKSNITNATDSQLVQQIQQFIIDGNFSGASTILANNPQLNGKIFNALDFNQLRDAVLALERFYNTDIEPYTIEKQTEWQNILNRFSFQGIYSPTTQYYQNNLVNYTISSGTFLYLCIAQPAIGITPDNTNYWRVMTVQGERGISGIGMSFTFLYNPTLSYSVNNITLYKDKWWGAIQANQGQVPYEGSPYWQVVLTSLPAIQIPIASTQPTNQIEGDQWYKIV
jgi:hypothetical protein